MKILFHIILLVAVLMHSTIILKPRVQTPNAQAIGHDCFPSRLGKPRVRVPRLFLLWMLTGLLILLLIASLPFVRLGDHWLAARQVNKAPDFAEFTRSVFAKAWVSSFSYWLGGAPAALPTGESSRLSFVVPPQAWQALTSSRQDALANRMLAPQDKRYVGAYLQTEAYSIPIELRLKGNFTDHIVGNKWSLQVKAYKGLGSFSLRAPYTRNYQADPVFLNIARYLDVLAPRTDIVDVTINGVDWGKMLKTESIDEHMLAAQNRSVGPILKFDDKAFWHLLAATPANERGKLMKAGQPNWQFADIRITSGKKPRNTNNNAMAKQRLSAFAAGELAAADVFDLDAVARFYVVCEVFSANHAADWTNLRWYYNPGTTRFEPIASDPNVQSHIPLFSTPRCLLQNALLARLLLDEKMRPRIRDQLIWLDQRLESQAFHQFFQEKEVYFREQLLVDYPWLRPMQLSNLSPSVSALQRWAALMHKVKRRRLMPKVTKAALSSAFMPSTSIAAVAKY